MIAMAWLLPVVGAMAVELLLLRRTKDGLGEDHDLVAGNNLELARKDKNQAEDKVDKETGEESYSVWTYPAPRLIKESENDTATNCPDSAREQVNVELFGVSHCVVEEIAENETHREDSPKSNGIHVTPLCVSDSELRGSDCPGQWGLPHRLARGRLTWDFRLL